MTKVLLLISAVVMAAACYVSYLNRDTFVQTRKDKNDLNANIGKELKTLVAMKGDLDAVGTQRDGVRGELEQEDERLAQAKIGFTNAQSQFERSSGELATTVAELNDLKEKLKDLPVGETLETIAGSTNKLKQNIADNETRLAKLKDEGVAKEAELKKAVGELDEVTKRLEERKKLFRRNSLVANVVAVNNDWGFLVVDSGRSQGITPETRLLVTRDNQTICKLAIVSVENNKTIANIVQKSLRRGITVSPGDKVILETLYQ